MTHTEAKVRLALGYIEQEVSSRLTDVERALDALTAAEELLKSPRAIWALPKNGWERLVVGLAVAVLRFEGRLSVPRREAVAMVEDALRVLATVRARRKISTSPRHEDRRGSRAYAGGTPPLKKSEGP